MLEIELSVKKNYIHTIVLIRTICLNGTAWNRNIFDN